MTRLEVQYAVRVPGPRDWIVLPERYTYRGNAERATRDRPDAEVVAQVVMVAGDWTDPDTAEQAVRDHEERERRHETLEVPAGLVEFEGEVGAELEAAGKDTEIIDLIEEVNGDGP